MTSADLASLVVDMLCTGKAESGPVHQRVITVVGLPLFCFVFMMIASLIKGFKAEDIDNVAIGKRRGLSDL